MILRQMTTWISLLHFFLLPSLLRLSQACDTVQGTTCITTLLELDAPCLQTSLDDLKQCLLLHLGACSPIDTTVRELTQNSANIRQQCQNPCLAFLEDTPCGTNGGICTTDSPDALGFTCDCPTGFTDSDTCEDLVNHCEANDACPDDSTCMSYPSGAYCICPTGYVWDVDSSTCIDIDECDNYVCQQICSNSEGSFTCSCANGYTLDTDDSITCVQDADFTCDSTCVNGYCIVTNDVEDCSCYDGFEKDVNDICQDITECTNSPAACDSCTELEPGFQCSCPDFMTLQEDGVTCRACQPGMYGTTCSETCACGDNGLYCHIEDGCICKAGYTGATCDTAIDYCAEQAVDYCGQGGTGTCENRIGTLECVCAEGYRNDQENAIMPCLRYDECVNSYDNECAEDETCVNIISGTYLCVCAEGESPSDTCETVSDCTVEQNNCDTVSSVCKLYGSTVICECLDGYAPSTDTTCEDINECLSNDCPDGSTCVDQVNDFTCDCPPGFEYDGTECQNINECLSNNCPDGSTCVDQVNEFTCDCPPGFEYDGTECQNIDDCASNTCPEQSTCVDEVQSSTCECDNAGYMYHEPDNSCQVTDVCLAETDNCPDESDCMTINDGHTCDCTVDGLEYNADSNACENINECNESPSPCLDGSTCMDMDPGFMCMCETGYQYDTTNDECECTSPGYTYNTQDDVCEVTDECLAETDNCPDDSDCMTTSDGHTCDCTVVGLEYNADSNACENINECNESPSPCLDGSTCMDMDPGFVCMCEAGYQYDTTNEECECTSPGYTYNTQDDVCEVTDECLAETDSCPDESDCMTTSDGYTCDCTVDGLEYNGDSNACENVDECDESPSPCLDGSTCVDMEPGFMCMCDAGFEYNTGDQECEEIDECDSDVCPQGSTCVDEVNGFTCNCAPGYDYVGTVCANVDECIGDTSLCSGGSSCLDTEGSYMCACSAGFLYDTTNEMCEDIDECADVECEVGDCMDRVGGFICPCLVDRLLLTTTLNATSESLDVDGLDAQEEVLMDIVTELMTALEEEDTNLTLMGCDFGSEGYITAEYAIPELMALTPTERAGMVEQINGIIGRGLNLSLGDRGFFTTKALHLVQNGKLVSIENRCTYYDTFDICGDDMKCELNDDEPECEEIDDNDDLRTIIIIVAVVGSVLLIAFAAIGAFICYKQHSRGAQIKYYSHGLPGNYIRNGPPVAHSISDKFSSDHHPIRMASMGFHEFTQAHNGGVRRPPTLNNRASWMAKDRTDWAPYSSGKTFNRNGSRTGAGFFSQSSKGMGAGNFHYQ